MPIKADREVSASADINKWTEIVYFSIWYKMSYRAYLYSSLP